MDYLTHKTTFQPLFTLIDGHLKAQIQGSLLVLVVSNAQLTEVCNSVQGTDNSSTYEGQLRFIGAL